jgi:hypothetical protein
MHNFMRVDVQSTVPSARWLPYQVRNAASPPDESHDCRLCLLVPLGLVGMGAFVVWVLTIIAVAYSNNEEVVGACGDGLRLIMSVQVSFSAFVFVCGGCYSMKKVRDYLDQVYEQCSTDMKFYLLVLKVCVAIIVGVGVVVMTTYTYILSANARATPECAAALTLHSAGTKSDLLAIMGIVHFGMWMVPIGMVGLRCFLSLRC